MADGSVAAGWEGLQEESTAAALTAVAHNTREYVFFMGKLVGFVLGMPLRAKPVENLHFPVYTLRQRGILSVQSLLTWRNWQTRTPQERMGKPLEVRILS